MGNSKKILRQLLSQLNDTIDVNLNLDTIDEKSIQLIQNRLSLWSKQIEIEKNIGNEKATAETTFETHETQITKIFFNSILYSLNDAVWSVSTDFSELFFINPSFEELTGYSQNDLIKEPLLIRKMIHPEDVYIFQNAQLFFNENGYSDYQYRIITKLNSIKWVHVKELLIRDEVGKSVRIDGVMSDITENKKAIENELNRASELLLKQEVLFKLSCMGNDYSFDEKLKKILQNVAKVTSTERTSVWVFDKQSRSLFTKCVYRLSADEFLPESVIEESVYPEYYRRIKEINHLKAIIVNDVTKGTFTSEILHEILIPSGISSILMIPLTKEDELFGVICLSHIGPKRIWTQDEQVFLTSIASIVSLAFEHEERRIIETALIEKTRILLEAQNVAKIGNYVIDLYTGEWKSSSVFDHIFGIERTYLRDFKNWLKLISPEYSSYVLNVFKEVLKQKTVHTKSRFQEEFKIIRQNDKAERWVKVLGEFQYDEFGNPTHMLGTMQDVTDSKKNNDELIKAKELAEELLTIKDDFLSNMSHEIRTPLNAIIGFTRLLKESELDEDQLEMMEAIEFSGKNLLVIVNDILDFSKMEANKMTFEAIPFSLSETVKNVLHLMILKAQEKNIELIYGIDAKLSDVLIGDPTRLNQILINLLGNAIKFTEEGFVELELNLVEDAVDSTEIEFKIKDTGIGIPIDKIDSIFESFNQASNDTMRKFGGSGLGLTITKKLIELQGGTIIVKSEVDKGSEFFFRLRFKKDPKMEVPLLEFRKEAFNPNFLENKRILIVEDILINQMLIVRILQKWKCELDIVNDGQQAVDALNDKNYDLILMDLQMPVLDGYEATRIIRERSDQKANIPIIALSAHANKKEEDKCILAGMNALVSKPIDEDFLLFELSKWLLASVKVQLPDKHLFKKKDKPKKKSKGLKKDSIINFEYLNSVTKGDKVFVAELVELVSTEMPKLLNRIMDFHELKNAESFKKEIHKLKSSITIFGIDRGKQLIYEMESNISETASLEGVDFKLKELQLICNQLLFELKNSNLLN